VTRVELPKLLESTQTEIQALLSSTQGLATRRFELVDKLSRLIVDLNSNAGGEAGDGEGSGRGVTVLEQLEGLQDELGRLEVSYSWIEIIERVVSLSYVRASSYAKTEWSELMSSEEILDKRNHSPSPLSTLGRYKSLCEIVDGLRRDLPSGMTLLDVIEGVREKTWAGLKEVMSK